MAVFWFLAIIIGFVGTLLFAVLWLFSQAVNRSNGWRSGRRVAAALSAAMLLASPYIAFKTAELLHVLSRVPEPLRASWIEYRLEKRWGIPFFGLPGDNETGFVTYRLTAGSARWARKKGARLNHFLPAGSREWRPTPVTDDAISNRWHGQDEQLPLNHPVDFREYLGRYGFDIPVEQRRIDEANRAIRSPGSFYRYGRGGSITVVDTRHGKVYFAYAG